MTDLHAVAARLRDALYSDLTPDTPADEKWLHVAAVAEQLFPPRAPCSVCGELRPLQDLLMDVDEEDVYCCETCVDELAALGIVDRPVVDVHLPGDRPPAESNQPPAATAEG